MLFNATKPFDVEKATKKFNALIEKQGRFELTEKKGNKTHNQNKYLHLILGWFAVEYGERVDYVKQKMFKKTVNKEIFQTEYVNKKTGEVREDLKSWADLDINDATLAITRFRNWSSQTAGIYLPEPDDLALLNQIEEELSKHDNKEFI
ncbi:hypothetical protein ACFLSU_04640 [Bacteroidota bacterium]